MIIVKLIVCTILLLIGGIVTAGIILWGVKFGKESKDLNGEDLDSPTPFLDIIRMFPIWFWVICILVLQGFISSILNILFPSLLSSNTWSFLRFIAFFAFCFYIILLNVTDDYGKLKSRKKKKKI
jgi:hypothetical protein